MKKMTLKFGETSINCLSDSELAVTNETKRRNGVITGVSESKGQTHIVIRSQEGDLPKTKLSMSLAGDRPDWAIKGALIEYEAR